MKWIISLIVAMSVLAITLIMAMAYRKGKYRRIHIFPITPVLFAGFFIITFVLFIPIYIVHLESQGGNWIDVIFLSIHYTMRLVVVDGEIEFISKNLIEASDAIRNIYLLIFPILFVLVPFFTFSFVLSFFKNISAWITLKLNYFSKIYVFSELNEKSISLAESYVKPGVKKLFVFTDVYTKDSEKDLELHNRAKELGAICFKKDILSINFKHHSKDKKLHFFAIGLDEYENINQSLKLISKYNEIPKTMLYLFSIKEEAEILISQVDRKQMRVRRINEVRSLIYYNLAEKGMDIYNNVIESHGAKHISAVVIGMGYYGTEMIKALTWFGQMDGYRLTINGFDVDKNAESKFTQKCPEIMEKKGQFTDDGEVQYDLNIHSNIDVDTIEFIRKIEDIKNITYVLVSLGDDEENIRVAFKLQTVFKRMGVKPQIQAVVYSDEKNEVLSSIVEKNKEGCYIEFVGNNKTRYSKRVIVNSNIQEKAKAQHMERGYSENDFFVNEYCYRSSIASEIHRNTRIACNLPGAELDPDDRNEIDREALRKLEHRRWCAFVRSEGYIHNKIRNDAAKQHNFLIPYDQLPPEQQAKDDV